MNYVNDYSGWGNEVLYRMCKERPLHNDVDTVSSKLWLIGRAYSASIERKAGKDFKIQQAAELIISSEIDSEISNIQKIDRPTHENIDQILRAHKHLMDVLCEATGLEKRSLASKYLHFHAPKAVFIYDSIANRNVRSILKGFRVKISNPYDYGYSAFCYRCIYYRDTKFEKEIGGLSTPRRLDMQLLQYGL